MITSVKSVLQASHWVSPLVGHRGRLHLSPFSLFVLLTFSPSNPGSPAVPGSPWQAGKKYLKFPHNLRRSILLCLILPVLLSVRSQALLSHPCAAGFGPGNQGWGWLAFLQEEGTRNRTLPAPVGGRSRVALKMIFRCDKTTSSMKRFKLKWN